MRGSDRVKFIYRPIPPSYSRPKSTEFEFSLPFFRRMSKIAEVTEPFLAHFGKFFLSQAGRLAANYGAARYGWTAPVARNMRWNQMFPA